MIPIVVFFNEYKKTLENNFVWLVGPPPLLKINNPDYTPGKVTTGFRGEIYSDSQKGETRKKNMLSQNLYFS